MGVGVGEGGGRRRKLRVRLRRDRRATVYTRGARGTSLVSSAVDTRPSYCSSWEGGKEGTEGLGQDVEEGERERKRRVGEEG